MFYPVESLKRGGRFYLCWVADSWPLRFATITHRQLWSQDIRRICDDLLEVMNNESGRPANRFSLRLSSQLMRGLVRLYQRKVTVLLGELCMINANVTKNVNKKWNIQEVTVVSIAKKPLPLLPLPALVPEELEPGQRIEDIIQNSGNIVSNIQDITLKETSVPQIVLPPNDGFGEENPDHIFKDQSIEMMMQDRSTAYHSSLMLDVTDKSHDASTDKSRRHLDAAQMERISEHDVTLFRKSTFDDHRLTLGEFEKDVPETPVIPFPDAPVPAPQPEPLEKDNIGEPQRNVNGLDPLNVTAPTAQDKEAVIELEELEEKEPQRKRRRGWKAKLIIDKKIKLSAEYLKARIENPRVELRCEDSSDDIVDIRIQADTLFRGACSRLGAPLLAMFHRAIVTAATNRALVDTRLEEAMIGDRSNRVLSRTVLERIEEEPALPILVQMEPPVPEVIPREPNQTDLELQNITVPAEQVDISDLPTQKLSQSRKRTSEYETIAKRPRLSGYTSFRQSQLLALEISAPNLAEKENLLRSADIQSPIATNVLQAIDTNIPRATNEQKSLTMMLEEAGLADLPQKNVEEPTIVSQTQRNARKGGSDRSETPLGSLDRTKVSLGDSEQTTDSKRFIRDQWGTEGTMVKILRSIKAELKPLTVKELISKGPVIAGYKAVMAARCFTSILKLKQHGFIVLTKHSETLEIQDIVLGPKFDRV